MTNANCVQVRHRCIVGGQHDDPLVALLHRGKIGHAQLLRYSGHWADQPSSCYMARKQSGQEAGD
jgi:hypothetical protein